MGDFNDILSLADKQGGRVGVLSTSSGLSHFMQIMGFVDLGFVGSKFTWCNKRLSVANIRERLDRGISNLPWRLAYPNVTITHDPITNSDHNPIILSLFRSTEHAPKPFKFKGFWLRDESCLSVVAAAWHSVGGDSSTHALFKKIRTTWFALRK